MGGRVDDDDEVALADSSGPIPYFNQAVLLRPLASVRRPAARAHRVVLRRVGRAAPHAPVDVADTRSLGAGLEPRRPSRVLRPRTRAARQPTRRGRDDRDRHHARATRGGGAHRGRRLPDGRARGIAAGHIAPRVGARHRRRVPHRIGRRRAGRGRVAAHGARHGEPLPRRDPARGAGAVCGRRSCGHAVDDDPELPAVAYTSDYSRPGFIRMGFLPITRFTLWYAAG